MTLSVALTLLAGVVIISHGLTRIKAPWPVGMALGFIWAEIAIRLCR